MRASRMADMTVEHTHADDPVSDEQLLTAVGRDRDQVAFDELFRRYEPIFFGLALRITGDREAAADAVQEAAIDIWHSAHSFRPDGCLRGWMSRIVARRGMKQIRDRQRRGKLVTSLTAEQEGVPANRCSEKSDREEVMSALGKALDDLPPVSRQLVALCYGGGLSQREVGAALQMPQTTVSFKLKEALNLLRGSLKSAGVATALPLVNPSDLGEAVCTGIPVPPGLRDRIMQGLTDAVPKTLKAASQRAVVAKGGMSVLVPGFFALAVAAIGAWFFLPTRGESPASKGPTSKPAVTSDAQGTDPGKPIRRAWRFTDGPITGFKEFGSTWKWVEAQGERPAGMMAESGKVKSGLRIPLTIPENRFWEVRIRGYQLHMEPGDSMALHVQWGVRKPSQRYTIFRRPHTLYRNGGPIESTNYLMDDGSWMVSNLWNVAHDKRMGTVITRFEDKLDRLPHLNVGAAKCIVTEIEVLEIKREAIPEPFGDLERAVRKLKLKPILRTTRQREVPLPESKPTD